VPLGLLLSTGIVALFERALPEPAFLSWGWRVPFYLSGVLIVVGLVVRTRILETPLFAQLQLTKQVARAPVRETLRRHWREVLLAAGTRLNENSCFYLFSVYVIAYAKDLLRVDPGMVLLAVNAAAAVEFFTIPLFGLLSDRWTRRGTYMLGCLVLIAFALPYYLLLGTREPVWIAVAVVLSLAGGHAMLYSVQASLIPELFGTRLRYTGASLGYQLAAPVAGGLSPLIAAWIVEEAPQQSAGLLALYVVLVSLVSLACVYLLAETSRKDLAAEAEPAQPS
jgi:MHS family shikimate/dehydroshikimate transporter-like MFS transporter